MFPAAAPAPVASTPAPAATPAACAPPSPPRALIEHQIATLSELAEIGMEIARAAGRAAVNPAADAAADNGFRGDPTLAYTRAARAVRLTFALQSRLFADLAALGKVEANAAYERKSRRRQGLQILVEEAVAAEYPDASAGELDRVSNELRENLRDGEQAEDLLDRPFAEAVAAICADLELSGERTAAIVAAAAGGFPTPSPLGFSRGPMVQPHGGLGLCAGRMDVGGAKPQDDGEEETARDPPPDDPRRAAPRLC